LPLSLVLLVILSEAKNPCISQGERSDPNPKNKSPKTAKSTAPKKHPPTNHLYQTIHHTLSTKNPHLPPVFRKNPPKTTHKKIPDKIAHQPRFPPQKIHHSGVYTPKV
jgi:hypothetical protein